MLAIMDPGDQGCAEILLARLHQMGVECEVIGPTDELPDGVALVVIAESLLARSDLDEIEERLRGRSGELVPVRFVSSSPGFLDDLSQLFVDDLGIEEVTRRAALVSRLTGATLAAWARLLDRGRDWQARSDDNRLLSQHELDEARILLSQPVAEEDPAATATVRQLTEASAIAIRGRRRRWATVVGSIGVFSTIVTVLALVASAGAISARSQAQHDGDTAGSARLLREASDLTDSDPDLPMILAASAATSGASKPSIEAIQTLLAESIPHRTFDLPGLPGWVSVARSAPSAVVTYWDDDAVDLIDIDTGEIQTVTQQRGGDVLALLAPQGDRVVVWSARSPRPRWFDTDSGNEVAWPSDFASVTPVAWSEDDHLLALRGRSLLSLNLDGNATTVVQRLPDAVSDPVGSDLRGSQLVLSGSGSLVLVDIDLGKVSSVSHLGDEGAVAIDSGGRTVYVASGAAGHLVPIGPDGFDAAELAGANAHQVAALPGSGFMVGDALGSIHPAASAGDDKPREIVAHPGGGMRIEPSGDGRVVTVGMDRRMRVWQPVPALMPSLGEDARPEQYGEYVFGRIGSFVQVGLVPCESQELLAYSGPAGVAALDAESLRPVGDVLSPASFEKVVFSPDFSRGLLAGEPTSTPFTLDCDGLSAGTAGESTWITGPRQRASWALSEDGRKFAAASSDSRALQVETEVLDTSDWSVSEEIAETKGLVRATAVAEDGAAGIVTTEAVVPAGSKPLELGDLGEITAAKFTTPRSGFVLVETGVHLFSTAGLAKVAQPPPIPKSEEEEGFGTSSQYLQLAIEFGLAGLHPLPRLFTTGASLAVIENGWVTVSSEGGPPTLIRDTQADSVAMTESTVFVGRDDGTIGVHPRVGSNSLVDLAEEHVPRSPTALEQREYAIEGSPDD